MKKPIILTIAALSILLFSFAPGRGVKKIGENLYSVSRATKFEKADQEQLKSLAMKYYHIKDFNRAKRLTPIAAPGAPGSKNGSWIFDSSVYKDFITTKFISWKVKQQIPEVEQVRGILQRYQ
jgi:hypothetical protein